MEQRNQELRQRIGSVRRVLENLTADAIVGEDAGKALLQMHTDMSVLNPNYEQILRVYFTKMHYFYSVMEHQKV